MKDAAGFILHLCSKFIITVIFVQVCSASPVKISNYNLVIPTVKINASTTTLCKGATISFTAFPSNAGFLPSYEWRKNGITVAGATLQIFSTADLQSGDVIQCILTADPSTPNLEASQAASNSITVTVFTEAFPSITIFAASPTVCPGSPVLFTSLVTNAGSNPQYKWTINGEAVGFESVLSYSNLNNNDKVVCYLTIDNPCNIRPFPSNEIIINAANIPVINIKPKDTLVLAGTQLVLQSSFPQSSNSFSWAPAELLVNPSSPSPITKPILKPATFKLSVKISDDCISTAETNVKVYRKLFMPNIFSPNSDRLNDYFRIPPDVPLELKEFSVFDRYGNKVFSTSNLLMAWDGRHKGKNLAEGTYIYIIRGIIDNKEIYEKNTVYLVR